MKKSWMDKYKALRIQHLKLQAKYARLKAKFFSKQTLKEPGIVTKKQYLTILSAYRRCQVRCIRLREKIEEI